MNDHRPVDAPDPQLRVFGFSLSFFRNRPLRRAFAALSVSVRFGWPTAADRVLVWGRANTAARGLKIAQRTGAGVVTAEDGFLRSVKTGRQGDQPLSVILDQKGIYFETNAPNDLADILSRPISLNDQELAQAKAGIAFLRNYHLSKYNDFSVASGDLPAHFVLVIDQTLNDASIEGAGAHAGSFQQMLDAALNENPDATVVIKTHPETQAGQRRGYFDTGDVQDRVVLFSEAVSPWTLMAAAQKVYCVSSTMGMEAIFAGHKPVLFGNAFYAGLGLSEDRHGAVPKRASQSAEHLFHAVYDQYCNWYDPYLDQKTDFMAVAQALSAQASFARQFSAPQVFVGMRLWKRGFLRRFFKGARKAPLFIDDTQKAVSAALRDDADVLVWSGKETPELADECAKQGRTLYRVEDGFLRSAGLGATLIEPVSLALDDLGIYYDPTRESRLEHLIAQSVDLPATALERAASVRAKMIDLKLSKYNLRAQAPRLSKGRHTVLIPGQVEDDQSILKGASDVKTNLDLVLATRKAFPDSYLIYKPHPDVLAGLRNGGTTQDQIAMAVDFVLPDANIAMLLDQVDCVSTITSLTGFEALLRDKQVLCYGAPFYAGWGADGRSRLGARAAASDSEPRWFDLCQPY